MQEIDVSFGTYNSHFSLIENLYNYTVIDKAKLIFVWDVDSFHVS